MNKESDTITTLEAREEPPVQAIIDEMENATCLATGHDVWTRLQRCANALTCVWDGKTGDGRQPKPDKWSKERKSLWRWEGAPDVAIPLVDLLVRWLTRLRVSVWNRGSARISPQRLPDEKGAVSPATGMAALWQTVMDFFLHLGGFDFSYVFGLHARIVEAFGYGVLLTDWRRKRRTEMKRMTLQHLVDALLEQRMAGLTPEETEAVDVQELATAVQMDVEILLADKDVRLKDHLDLVMAVDPLISESEALAVLKELRKNPFQPADYFVPRDDGGEPVLRAFIPWAQCIHSADMSGTGECTLFGYPEYLNETQLREASVAGDWDADAFEQFLEQGKNKLYYTSFDGLNMTVPDWAFNGVGIGMKPDLELLARQPHWMVWHVWRRGVNDKGLPCIYRGVLSPYMPEAFLKWSPTDLTRIPITVDTSEPVSYALLARGVADITVSMQNGIKDTMDSEGARGRLGSNPPFMRASSLYVGMRPGLEINGSQMVSGLDDKLNRFVEVPGVDQGSFRISQELERWAREYYCYAPTTDPDDKRLFMEDLTFKSLRVMSRVLVLMWEQIQENIQELHASSIAGRAVDLDVNRRDQLAGQADVNVAFHVDGLLADRADKFFDLLLKIMQADRAARVDWNEAIEMAVQMRVPSYANRLLMSREQAQENVKMDQELRMVKIANGVPLDYPEIATNPEARMGHLKQWQAIPGNQPQTPAAQALLDKEAQYLQFQIEQYTRNPTIGRTGVTPNDDLSQQAA